MEEKRYERKHLEYKYITSDLGAKMIVPGEMMPLLELVN